VNYFAHAIAFLDDPYFAAGTGVPDWLSVVDRAVRVRLERAGRFVDDRCGVTRSVARGIVQHIRDDARFHESRAFAELTYGLSALVRDVLGGESGMRPSFLGHLLVEVLLDACLIAEDPGRLGEYYRVIDSVDPGRVEGAVNRMAPRPTRRLAPMIRRFCRERILSDYGEDAKLRVRLDQVMRRVKLAPLPGELLDVLPEARRAVALRREELLDGIPA
jgi:hypothetical protein